MARTPDTTVEYDPEQHAGLLYVEGREFIIADAVQAKLDELPEDVRREIARQTATQLAVMDFSRGVGGVIIEITDEARAAKLEKGYKEGLRLLGFPEGRGLK